MKNFTLKDGLEKFKKGFNNGHWENLNYRIDEIISYLDGGALEILTQSIDTNAFTLRAYCGCVYCVIEYNGYLDDEERKQYGVKYICGATFENEITGEKMLIQNIGNWQEHIFKYNENLFSIFD